VYLHARTTSKVERFAALAVVGAADYMQTARFLFGSDFRYQESNPIIGPNPLRKDLLVYGSAGYAAIALASELLPDALGDFVIDSAAATLSNAVAENKNVLDQKDSFHTYLFIASFKW
jgi:hypothetical protein